MTDEKPSLSFRDAVVRFERGAASFYRRIARSVDHPRHVEVLEYLAREEEEHARAMARLARSEDLGPRLAEAFRASEELLFFLVEEAEALTPLAAVLDSQEKILKLALQAEKNSILFYAELRTRADDSLLGPAFDAVLAEERKHFQTFYDLLKLTKAADPDAPVTVGEMRNALRMAAERDEASAERPGRPS
jgi:rubrerythrin